MKIVRYVDLGKVSNTIHCQFPQCKRKPFLRHVFYLEDGTPVGSFCKNKVENQTFKTKAHKKDRKKAQQNSNTPLLRDLYVIKPEGRGVTPHVVWQEDKQINESEYL